MNKFSRVAVGVALFCAAVYVFALWEGQQPSIKPEDVVFDMAVLTRPHTESEWTAPPVPAGTDRWILILPLHKRTDRPLQSPDGKWSFQVSTYLAGMTPVASTATETGVTFGTGGGVIPELRHLPPRGIMLTEDIIPKLNTFTYTGDRFPLEVRYFLPGPLPEFASVGSVFLLYSHYEKRWGKDLSWTKSTGLSLAP